MHGRVLVSCVRRRLLCMRALIATRDPLTVPCVPSGTHAFADTFADAGAADACHMHDLCAVPTYHMCDCVLAWF